jgi:HK97 family phage major capsid protein
MTQKGWNTDFAGDIQEKAGIDYASNAADIDQEVSRLIEKEIMNELKVARMFREVPVNGKSTVLPIQVDVDPAAWATNATSGNLENRGASNATYQPKQVILNAYRLISSTFMDNEVDEQVLVNLMPMLVEGVARAHGRAVEAAILNGNGTISGLDGHGAIATAKHDIDGASLASGNFSTMTGAQLLAARKEMGKYGLNPSDVTFIVSQNMYYDLLSDSAFQSLDEVGTELAIKVTGTVGAVFGSPVIVSEEFAAEGAGVPVAYAVYARNYVIPRLRGVTVEQDYEVMNQRRVIVASQSLGFEEIVAGAGADQPCVKIDLVA